MVLMRVKNKKRTINNKGIATEQIIVLNLVKQNIFDKRSFISYVRNIKKTNILIHYKTFEACRWNAAISDILFVMYLNLHKVL